MAERTLDGGRLPLLFIGSVTALLVTPVLMIVLQAGADSGDQFRHLASTRLPDYVRNTLWLALGVASTTAVIGVGTAWLVTLLDFPGRSFFRWSLLLPLGIPTYLAAYAYTDLLQFSGPVQTFLRTTFEWTRDDYVFPQIRSLTGAIAILSLAYYPYVYLAARAAFIEQSVCVLEVGKTLGLGPWRRFFRIALPLAWPSVFAGLSLVVMETLAEFGAVDYFAVDTFATGIYRTFMSPVPHALTSAAQLSALLLLPILLLIAAEAFARRRARFFHTSVRYRAQPPERLRGWRAALAVTTCAVPILLGFLVPTVFFVRAHLRSGDSSSIAAFLERAQNSLVLATVASVLAVALALLVTFARRLEPSWANRFLTRIAGLGYAVPGGVIAIGVLIPLSWLDHKIGDLADSWLGISTGLLFTGTIVAVVYGYLTRVMAVSLNLVQAGLTRVQPSLDAAARTLGARPRGVLRRLHLPMLRGSLIAAGLLVFVDVIKELPATMIFRPAGFETLAVRVHELASQERLYEASTGALAIIVAGLIPVAILARTLDRARPGTDTDPDDIPIGAETVT
ncbi:MAG: iron ABC transporter permease [Acidobacteriota bacterium]